ncbi:hypothetical protein EYR41_004930 [Orbilia oligospora]|uniref:Uncharacterized protein n=1 Tax=Orbilia oligospora TaxID=2813651 RepID=A0A8H2E1N9_ORBOL|nr:hypothetical protein EYR41_004930 [Orbilia oligospora]
MASLSVEYAPQYRWDSRRDFVAVGTAIHYIALQDNIWDGMELALTVCLISIFRPSPVHAASWFERKQYPIPSDRID